MKEKDLFTAANLAEEWGISVAKVKKAIESLALNPDSAKGACKYYSKESAAKIKSAIK